MRGGKMKEKITAFISYSTVDKLLAGKLKELLTSIEIETFLAHEDIEPSEEWLIEIKKNLESCTLFFCILSEYFSSSIFCIQETGMADILKKPIMPLSIDGTNPPGFISRIQAKKIKFQFFKLEDIIQFLLKYDKYEGINIIINAIGKSEGWVHAFENYKLIENVHDELDENQALTLLNFIADNSQIYGSFDCQRHYIPKTLEKYGNLLDEKEYARLKRKCHL